MATCRDRLPGVSPARPHSTAAGRWCRQDGSRSHPATPGAIDHPAPPAGRQPHLPGQAGPEAEPGSPSRAAPPGHAPVRQRETGRPAHGRHPSARRPAAGSARAGCAASPRLPCAGRRHAGWGPLGKRKLSYAKPVFCTYYYSLSVMRGIYPVPV